MYMGLYGQHMHPYQVGASYNLSATSTSIGKYRHKYQDGASYPMSAMSMHIMI